MKFINHVKLKILFFSLKNKESLQTKIMANQITYEGYDIQIISPSIKKANNGKKEIISNRLTQLIKLIDQEK
jgi:hypothetical protein